MSSRRRQDTSPLQRKVDPAIQSEWDATTYGVISGVDADMQTAYSQSIYQIMPDPAQPRRLLPGSLRYTEPIRDVLAAWWDMAADESVREIPVEALLKGEPTERSTENVDRGLRPIEAGFLKLIDLAATIRQDGGLINPITIYRSGEGFRLETGERRWLAHHLLAVGLNETKWEKITAREVGAPSIWRQAHENNDRDNLNAISLARQFALLMMDIYGQEGREFLPYEEFGHDRHFYAQVSNGTDFPIPYGDGERVVAAMGLKNRVQVNQYRALLRLPDNTWQIGDEGNWTERKLRDIVNSAIQAERDAERASMQTQQSITTVIDSPQDDTPKSKVVVEDRQPEDPEATQIGDTVLPKVLLDLLAWAYRRTAPAINDNETWFSAGNAGIPPEKLNQMAKDGLIQLRRPDKENHSHAAAVYRLTPKACEVINEPILSYDFTGRPNNLPPGADKPGFTGAQTQPVSETGALSGAGMPDKKTPATPPRRHPKKLFDSTQRALIVTAMELTNEHLDDADGRANAINDIDLAVGVLHRKLSELRSKE